jgi:hypothetical protein
MPDSEQPNTFLQTIRNILSPEKIPGWTGLLILALLQIASVSGAIELYMPAIRAVGGIAVTLIDTITSPTAAIVLALLSGLYSWAVSGSSPPYSSGGKGRMALFKGNNRKRGCSLRLFHRWDLVAEAGAGGFGMGLAGR